MPVAKRLPKIRVLGWVCVVGGLLTAVSVQAGEPTAGGEAAAAGAETSAACVDEVQGPIAWGSLANVKKLQRFYLSGQPDAAALAAARDAGVSLVINMRAPEEFDWDEAAAVRALGMEYHNVPVSGASFDPTAFERIESLVSAHKSGGVYLHCASGNRAGGWLATHLVLKQGLAEDEAVACARAAGIRSDAVEQRARAYLSKRPASEKE